MRKTYRVFFIDHNGHYNQKLLEADNASDVYNYMFDIGYIVDKLEEVSE